MNINGYDYHFAYTVGAFCDISDLHLERPKTMAEQCKVITQMAVIMSKAYEDMQKLEDPAHEVRYLTLQELRALSVNRIMDELTPEVDSAVKAGAYRTVEAQPEKKATGAAQ
jgi:hypothetical protein